MKYVYPAVFTPEENDYFVEFPDLETAVTQGKDLYEALYMAQDVLRLVLADMENRGQKIPAASGLPELKLEGNQFVNLICADTDEKRRAS